MSPSVMEKKEENKITTTFAIYNYEYITTVVKKKGGFKLLTRQSYVY